MAFFMSQQNSDDLQETITSFTKNFSMYMILAFKDVVIEKKASELEGGDGEDEHQLMDLPVPDWNIKTGFLTKRGGARKNWNKRYFVAKNKADGYLIEYYTDDKLKTKKGQISCAGYKAKKDEKTKKHGILLIPKDETRRTWYIACDNAEEQEQWFSVFDFACDYATPATDPDEDIQAAFEIAFENLKNSCDIWWSMEHDRPPPEMLSKLLFETLNRKVLRDILNEVSDPTGMLKSTAQSMVKSLAANMCSSACYTAWAGAKPGIDAIKNMFMEKVGEMIDPIIKAQIDVKAKIVESTSSVTDPAMSKIAEIALAPVVDMAMEDIVAAFRAGMRGFHSQVEKKLAELGDADEAVRTRAMRNLINNVSYSYWHESPMVEAYQILRDLRDSKLGDVLSDNPNISVYHFIWELDNGLRTLIKKAIYTCTKLSEEMGDPNAALKETMDRFVADSQLEVRALVFSGLKAMIMPLVSENILNPCLELVKPLSDAIPGPLQEIVNIDSLLSGAVEEIVENGVAAAASSSTGSAATDLVHWQ